MIITLSESAIERVEALQRHYVEHHGLTLSASFIANRAITALCKEIGLEPASSEGKR